MHSTSALKNNSFFLNIGLSCCHLHRFDGKHNPCCQLSPVSSLTGDSKKAMNCEEKFRQLSLQFFTPYTKKDDDGASLFPIVDLCEKRPDGLKRVRVGTRPKSKRRPCGNEDNLRCLICYKLLSESELISHLNRSTVDSGTLANFLKIISPSKEWFEDVQVLNPKYERKQHSPPGFCGICSAATDHLLRLFQTWKELEVKVLEMKALFVAAVKLSMKIAEEGGFHLEKDSRTDEYRKRVDQIRKCLVEKGQKLENRTLQGVIDETDEEQESDSGGCGDPEFLPEVEDDEVTPRSSYEEQWPTSLSKPKTTRAIAKLRKIKGDKSCTKCEEEIEEAKHSLDHGSDKSLALNTQRQETKPVLPQPGESIHTKNSPDITNINFSNINLLQLPEAERNSFIKLLELSLTELLIKYPESSKSQLSQLRSDLLVSHRKMMEQVKSFCDKHKKLFVNRRFRKNFSKGKGSLRQMRIREVARQHQVTFVEAVKIDRQKRLLSVWKSFTKKDIRRIQSVAKKKIVERGGISLEMASRTEYIEPVDQLRKCLVERENITQQDVIDETDDVNENERDCGGSGDPDFSRDLEDGALTHAHNQTKPSSSNEEHSPTSLLKPKTKKRKTKRAFAKLRRKGLNGEESCAKCEKEMEEAKHALEQGSDRSVSPNAHNQETESVPPQPGSSISIPTKNSPDIANIDFSNLDLLQLPDTERNSFIKLLELSLTELLIKYPDSSKSQLSQLRSDLLVCHRKMMEQVKTFCDKHQKLFINRRFRKNFTKGKVSLRQMRIREVARQHQVTYLEAIEIDRQKKLSEGKSFKKEDISRIQIVTKKKIVNGRTFYRDIELIKTDSGKIKCGACGDIGKGAASEKSVMTHINKRHTDLSNAYKCDYCEKRFYYHGELENHVRITHKKTRFQCHLCGETCATNSGIYFHRKIVHEGHKPHTCEHCGKSFGTRKDMTIHVRRHTGERPFVCHICAATFVEKQSMKKHIRTKHADAVEQVSVPPDSDAGKL